MVLAAQHKMMMECLQPARNRYNFEFLTAGGPAWLLKIMAVPFFSMTHGKMSPQTDGFIAQKKNMVSSPDGQVTDLTGVKTMRSVSMWNKQHYNLEVGSTLFGKVKKLIVGKSHRKSDNVAEFPIPVIFHPTTCVSRLQFETTKSVAMATGCRALSFSTFTM